MKHKILIPTLLLIGLLASCGNRETISVGYSSSTLGTSIAEVSTEDITRRYIEPAKETQPPISFYYDENNNLIGVFETTPPETQLTTTQLTSTTSENITDDTTTSEVTTTTTTTSSYIIPPNNFEPIAKQDFSYFDDCAFVGDSLIKSLSGFLLIDESSVIAKIGISPKDIVDTPFDTYYGYMTTLDALKQRNASKVYILLGSNSLDSYSSSEDNTILNYYGEFIDQLKENLPNTIFYVISVTPVTDYCKYDLSNERIANFNVKLYSMCTKRGVYFIDAFSQWFDEDNQILSEFYEPDGMHLRSSGCDKLLDILLENTAQ